MKILIYSHVPLWEVHHSEALELAFGHLDKGDEVYFLTCHGSLSSCPANSFHDLKLCKKCVQQTLYSKNTILEKRVKHIVLDLKASRETFPEFSGLEELKRYVQYDTPFGELVVSQIVDDLSDCYIDFDKYKEKLELHLSNSIALFREAKHIITTHSFDKVYVWNGRRSSDGPVSYAAKHLGIPFVSFISGGKINTYWTISATKVHDLPAIKTDIEDLYLKFIEINESYIISEAAIFFNERRYGGGNFPGNIRIAENFSNETFESPFKDKKPILAVYPGSQWEFYAMGDWFHSYSLFTSQYDTLYQILFDKAVTTEFNIIIRWHPNLVNSGAYEQQLITKIISETTSEGVFHIRPDQKLNSYLLLDMVDTVVTFGSTIGIEAAYYGKKSILLGRAMYENTGSVYTPQNYHEFIATLNSDFKALPKTGAIKYGFWERNKGQSRFEYIIQDNGQWFHKRKRIKFISVKSKIFSKLRQMWN